jgi:hypothetical protein
VHHMLPVSLDCPFLICPSVFSNTGQTCINDRNRSTMKSVLKMIPLFFLEVMLVWASSGCRVME